ncbi:surface repeat SSSPR-51 protein [Breznakia blatticola]|uniref:Surface repeat SSSPR-51 protein n=1 Tax=Breznakia blatticola TaxID=1754012 RepID=A0A4R7ZIA3_9FIRM|nr:C39 family peptidase [Breznakia blatticola]TDW16836.1 surface repeat SSSPR-51 protein [Breznakia blatticola]
MLQKVKGAFKKLRNVCVTLFILCCVIISGCGVEASDDTSKKSSGATLSSTLSTYEGRLIPLKNKNADAKQKAADEEAKKKEEEEKKKKEEEDAKREAEAKAYLEAQTAKEQERYRIEQERQKAAEEAEKKGQYNPSYYDLPRTLQYYSQRDPRWASHAFNPAWNMANSGCVPTSLAMALTAAGIPVSPVTVADYLYYNTNEFNKQYIGTTGVGIRIAAEHYGATSTNLMSQQQLVEALAKGQTVVAAVGPGNWAPAGASHAIVLNGYSNGYTYVYDVYSDTRSGAFLVSSIWNQRSSDPVDANDGGALFHAITKVEVVKTEDTIWVDEAGSVLRAKENGTKLDNDGISDIPGYSVVSATTTTDENGNMHTVNTYHRIVTTTVWQDEQGTILKTKIEGNMPDNDNVSDIAGYILLEIKTIKDPNGDTRIINIYRKAEASE